MVRCYKGLGVKKTYTINNFSKTGKGTKLNDATGIYSDPTNADYSSKVIEKVGIYRPSYIHIGLNGETITDKTAKLPAVPASASYTDPEINKKDDITSISRPRSNGETISDRTAELPADPASASYTAPEINKKDDITSISKPRSNGEKITDRTAELPADPASASYTAPELNKKDGITSISRRVTKAKLPNGIQFEDGEELRQANAEETEPISEASKELKLRKISTPDTEVSRQYVAPDKSTVQSKIKKTVQIQDPDSTSDESEARLSIIKTEDEGSVEDASEHNNYSDGEDKRRRSGVAPVSVRFDKNLNEKLPVHVKHSEDEELIRRAIQKNEFVHKIISTKRMDDVIAAMYSKEISANEIIIKQGDKGSHMYVSAKGKYQVLVKGKVVSEFEDERIFGELAILYNAKRLATIKAVTAGRVWVLDQKVYLQIVMRYNIKEQDETMEFLLNNPILNIVGKSELQEVANLLKSEFFPPGVEIVRQGDKGHKFYIIRAGTVTITREGEGVVGIYKKGDCFGELALLKEDCRQATVTADDPGVECLTLTRKEFISHFGELKYFNEIKSRPKDSIKTIVAEHEDIVLNELRIRKTLGVGGFGRVELVQHIKKADLVFALKYLKKIDIVLQNQQEHVYNEKNIQMGCKSPFIVRLYRTYRDSKYIYFLMESCLGGDLWSHLQKQKNRRFDEKDARFICACVLEAFDYLHSRGIIYRDLKPENLLLDVKGYVKLTDFGFAKKITARGKTYTFAGTPEYVAPEIVLNRGHDRAVDYWAYGAFIFEMLTGRTPFRTDDSSHMRTYNKILSGIDNIPFPSYINIKSQHIIERLCRPVPSERLGMQKGGIKDIKSHKWFQGFDWQKFGKCEITSPFKIKLNSPIDTKYFDHFSRDEDVPPDEISGWDDTF